jgi:hypothetical protein
MLFQPSNHMIQTILEFIMQNWPHCLPLWPIAEKCFMHILLIYQTLKYPQYTRMRL